MDTDSHHDRIVVIGGGYAGITAANRLQSRGMSVTLVTTTPWLVERIRLHRVASGDRPNARRDLDDVIHPDVTVLIDEAVRIDSAAREVHLASGEVLPYQAALYAVGSGTAGERHEYAHTIANEHGALKLRQALSALPNSPVTIVGGGLTGVELAASIVRTGRETRLVTRGSMQTGREDLALKRALGELGVQVRTQENFIFDDHTDDSIVVDTTGLNVPALARDSDLPVTDDGHLVVDAYLRVPGHPGVYGAGDAVRIEADGYEHLRDACATAMPMGAHGADVIAGIESPFSLGYVAHCVDLGADRGRIQFVDASDAERPFAFGGVLGGLAKETINRMTIRWISGERVRAGKYRWAAGPTRDAVDPAGFQLSETSRT